MKQTIIKIPIFDQEVVLLQGENLDNIISYLQDVEGECNYRQGSDACVVDYNDGRIFLCIKNNPSLFIILHECVHVIYSIFRRVGIN